LTIPKEFIGAVIGPGGKIIQQMQEDTGATITIDEADGVGTVQVSAPNKESIDAAIAKIKAIVAVPEVGEIYEGTVRSIMPYGCFVEFMPGKEGLLHISEIDWKRLETVEEAGIKEGDKIKVKLIEIDPKTGKYKLSHRVLMLLCKVVDFTFQTRRLYFSISLSLLSWSLSLTPSNVCFYGIETGLSHHQTACSTRVPTGIKRTIVLLNQNFALPLQHQYVKEYSVCCPRRRYRLGAEVPPFQMVAGKCDYGIPCGNIGCQPAGLPDDRRLLWTFRPWCSARCQPQAVSYRGSLRRIHYLQHVL
jgi:hypothetical protein